MWAARKRTVSDAIRDTWYLGGGSVRLNYTHMQYGIHGLSDRALCMRY